MANNIIQKSKLQHVNLSGDSVKDDFLAIESPLEIRIGHNKNEFFTLTITLCSPSDIKFLVLGYLFSENVIENVSQIKGISIYNSEFGQIAEAVLDQSINLHQFLNKRNSIMHSSCGVCGKTEFDQLMMATYPKMKSIKNKISNKTIMSLPEKLNLHQKAFTQTGGIHASALFDSDGNLLEVKEDIGRHNALDKLIGVALEKQQLPLTGFILLLSGRVSFELVHKALMAGVTTLVAIGAPSSLSVELAKSNHLTLFGFVKNNSFNKYT